MITIKDKVKLLEVNENDLLNEFINDSYLEIKELLKNEISKIDFEATIIIDGTPENYNFKIKSDNERSILTLESIIDRLFN